MVPLSAVVIVPLGGVGERFKKRGFLEPKALVPVDDKPILFHLLDNLSVPGDDVAVCIPYNKEYQRHNLEDLVQQRYPTWQLRFLCLEEQTRGAAETLLRALEALERDKEIGRRWGSSLVLCLGGRLGYFICVLFLGYCCGSLVVDGC